MEESGPGGSRTGSADINELTEDCIACIRLLAVCLKGERLLFKLLLAPTNITAATELSKLSWKDPNAPASPNDAVKAQALKIAYNQGLTSAFSYISVMVVSEGITSIENLFASSGITPAPAVMGGKKVVTPATGVESIRKAALNTCASLKVLSGIQKVVPFLQEQCPAPFPSKSSSGTKTSRNTYSDVKTQADTLCNTLISSCSDGVAAAMNQLSKLILEDPVSSRPDDGCVSASCSDVVMVIRICSRRRINQKAFTLG